MNENSRTFPPTDGDERATLTGFLQRDPVDGAPATERTEVRIGFTPTALYFGTAAGTSVTCGGTTKSSGLGLRRSTPGVGLCSCRKLSGTQMVA